MKKSLFGGILMFVLFGFLVNCFAEEGLILHYDFKNVKGTKVIDKSKSKINGDIKGKIEWENTKFGNALKLDGESTYIDCGTDSDFGKINASIELRLKIDPTYRGGIVTRSKGGSWLDERFVIAMASHGIPEGQPGNLIFSVSDGKSYAPISFKQIPTNEWIHLVLTFEKSSVKLYVDSKLITTENVTALTPDIKAIPLRIGFCEGLGTPFFKGSIKEVKLYDRALTEKEIIEHHNSESKSIPSQKKGKEKT